MTYLCENCVIIHIIVIRVPIRLIVKKTVIQAFFEGTIKLHNGKVFSFFEPWCSIDTFF